MIFLSNLKHNLAVKITAVILSFFTFIISVAGLLGIILLVYMDFYTSSYNELKSNLMENLSYSETFNAAHRFYECDDIESYYSDKNVLVTIEDEDGNKLFSNYEGQDYISCVSDTHEFFEYEIVDDKDTHYDSVYLNVTIYIPKEMKYTDRFALVAAAVDVGYSLKFWIIPITALSIIFTIFLYCFLHMSAGWRKYADTPQLNHFDKIPFDIHCGLVFSAVMLNIVLLDSIYDYRLFGLAAAVLVIIDYFILLGFTMSFATRLKTKTLLKNTVIYRVLKALYSFCRKIGKNIMYVFKNLNTIWKTAVCIAGVSIIETIIFFANIWEPDNLAVFWIIRIILFSGIILLAAIGFSKVKTGGEKIASGDLNSKIDTKYLYGDLKELSDSLNNINNGLQAAVLEKMKSERFKTELITNVSHDIKTPVTSIINYVDLIKKENITEEPLKGYIDVLDRQSCRLKKLTEDIVEASKAATGNLTVNLSQCEVGVLLAQTLGEFSERLEKNNITPIISVPESDVKILADGRLLWRIFDNLMNNVCKYAQNGTRVYLGVEEINGTAVITFRNISRYPLNISSNELMERFVRGDSSRNTEGSGLGLSIAKSLTELQKGTFELVVDGDLFKVILTFDEIQGEL